MPLYAPPPPLPPPTSTPPPHTNQLKADELKKRGADQAKTRSELRKMEGEIKEKLDAMSKWLKKQTKGRKKSKFSVDELKNRNLTWKLLSKKLKSLSMPTDDVDAPRANVSEFLSEGGGGGGGASAGGEDFEASNSEEEEEMTMEHTEALLKAKAEEEKQDVILRLIESELLQIKDHASTIGDALEDQEKMYEKAHSKVQEMNQKMEDVNVKLEATNQDAEKDHPELICVCICCVGVLLGLAIVAYKLLVQYMEAKNSNSNNNNRLMM